MFRFFGSLELSAVFQFISFHTLKHFAQRFSIIIWILRLCLLKCIFLDVHRTIINLLYVAKNVYLYHKLIYLLS